MIIIIIKKYFVGPVVDGLFIVDFFSQSVDQFRRSPVNSLKIINLAVVVIFKILTPFNTYK